MSEAIRGRLLRYAAEHDEPAWVIERAGVRNIVILATPIKMQETRTLYVDTGSRELDEKLRGYGKVLVGYAKQLVAPIE